jgi:hypothetical protein
LDVHRNTISVATLLPDQTLAAVEQIPQRRGGGARLHQPLC